MDLLSLRVHSLEVFVSFLHIEFHTYVTAGVELLFALGADIFSNVRWNSLWSMVSITTFPTQWVLTVIAALSQTPFLCIVTESIAAFKLCTCTVRSVKGTKIIKNTNKSQVKLAALQDQLSHRKTLMA